LATALQFVNEVTVESPLESPALRRLARFFFATFWVIVFTGAIRKWIFPGTSALYLLQDIPLVAAYAYALWTGLFTRGYMLLGLLFLSLLLMLQGLAQILVSGLNVFVALVGFHNYLLYLPMLIVFPLCLTEKYRKDFVWWNLILSIPMALLAVAQAEAPRSAWINKTSEGEAFGVVNAEAEVARVSGTFNFVSFYAIWVGLVVALCMGEWLLPKHRRSIKSTWLLLICTLTANMCHLISASRSAIALAGVAILGALVAAVVLGSQRAMLAIAGVFLLVPIGAGLTYAISPAEFNIMQERFTGEREVGDSKSRLLEGLIGFAYEPPFSLVGAGIGVGTDAAHIGSNDAYNFTYQLSEFDIIRNVMELGTPVGLIYVLARIVFILGMVFISIRIVRDGSSPHVLPLSFFLLAQSYQGDWTRGATMSSTQVMIGYSFILGAYFYPDTPSLEPAAGELLTRSV
jgi:hypothetical protein